MLIYHVLLVQYKMLYHTTVPTAQYDRRDLLVQQALYQNIIYTYIDCNACSGSGAVTFSHAALQHLLHNLCCDWQASINLGSLCSIIISPAIQLDSTQQASWHCGASQKKFQVSRQGCCLLLQLIFYGSTCQYNAEYSVNEKHTLARIWHYVKSMRI